MSNRHERRGADRQHRAAISDYRRAVGRELLTYLVAVDDLPPMPLLRDAAELWLSRIARMAVKRQCIVCDLPFIDKRDVGAVLLSHAAHGTGLASVSGVCVACFFGDLAAIERSVEKVLGKVVPRGRLEPFAVTW